MSRFDDIKDGFQYYKSFLDINKLIKEYLNGILLFKTVQCEFKSLKLNEYIKHKLVIVIIHEN